MRQRRALVPRVELPCHCPATVHDVGREQGNVRNHPDLVLTYMGALFTGACSGGRRAARWGRGVPRPTQTFDAPICSS